MALQTGLALVRELVVVWEKLKLVLVGPGRSALELVVELVVGPSRPAVELVVEPGKSCLLVRVA